MVLKQTIFDEPCHRLIVYLVAVGIQDGELSEGGTRRILLHECMHAEEQQCKTVIKQRPSRCECSDEDTHPHLEADIQLGAGSQRVRVVGTRPEGGILAGEGSRTEEGILLEDPVEGSL